ncbi:hypothetical protein GLYMA_17G204401v4 [Glycine max]|nr:hypothetical protein GLYMA_17G204401v4 [Glycine max]KAH1119313.1 hypothetical protein GYH30_047915 [Glycine max]
MVLHVFRCWIISVHFIRLYVMIGEHVKARNRSCNS